MQPTQLVILCALAGMEVPANARFAWFAMPSWHKSVSFPPVDSVPTIHHHVPPTYYPPITSTRWKNWRPPGPKDHRGPCPGLNTLANHGFINRNGTMLKPDDVAKAGVEAFHIPYVTMYTIASDAVATIGNLTRGDFSLGNYGTTNREFGMGLSTHGNEHDCSLTREDAYIGNSRKLNIDLFNRMMSVIDEQGKDVLDVEGMVEVIRRRDLDSRARNPLYNNNLRDRIFQFGEAAAVMTILGANIERPGTVSKDHLISFFVHEKIPEDYVPLPVTEDKLTPLRHFVEIGAKLYYANPLSIANARVDYPKTLDDFNCATFYDIDDSVHIHDYIERLERLNLTLTPCSGYRPASSPE